MELKEFFPIWGKISQKDREILAGSAVSRSSRQGMILHNENSDCDGLYAVKSGQLRVFISREGREITLFRLLERDICLLSASCILSDIQFDVLIQAEKDTEYYTIPSKIYKQLMNTSVEISNFTNQIMSARLTEVLWLIEQIVFKRLDSRLAEFLIDECHFEGSDKLKLTHEQIAAHLGTAREVISRMLKYFESEGTVKLSRGVITLTDMEKLKSISQM
ncbi:MAG TPA: Crp/Fnr family transcriptional regulator [Clostridiales bacterium]|nr:Crp/Fnr family transcriptional regulator [Clostridiales bacterium]